MRVKTTRRKVKEHERLPISRAFYESRLPPSPWIFVTEDYMPNRVAGKSRAIRVAKKR
jgi:hypothetical protein